MKRKSVSSATNEKEKQVVKDAGNNEFVSEKFKADAKFLTQTSSFITASEASVAEPGNKKWYRQDVKDRSKMGGILSLSHLSTTQRRVSVNRANIVRTDAVESLNIEDMFEFTNDKDLGKGSYGTVSKVRDKLTGELRALKVIHKPSVENSIRLQREILIMKRLDHPSIIKLYSVYEDAMNLYFVMELCKGGELFDRIVKNRYYNEFNTASLMRQLLSALAYAHGNCIMHRDIKPENVLYYENGPDDGAVKLIDWGFSAKFHPHQRFRSVVGTPYYVAPEVLDQYYDYRCDLWSAGVMMYIMLSGGPPFYGDDNKAILKAVQRGKYDLQRKRWSTVSELAKNLVRRLLVKDVDVRLSAAEALSHPWVVSYQPLRLSIDQKMGLNLIRKFKRFHSLSLLQRVSYTCRAHTMADDNIARTTFFALDEKGDGVLTVSSIVNKLVNAGCYVDETVLEYLSAIDTDGNGTIDYTEFAAVIIADTDGTFQNDGFAQEAFQMICAGKEKIDVDVLETLMRYNFGCQSHESVPMKVSKNIIQEVKGCDSGTISYEVFLDHIRKASSPQKTDHVMKEEYSQCYNWRQYSGISRDDSFSEYNTGSAVGLKSGIPTMGASGATTAAPESSVSSSYLRESS